MTNASSSSGKSLPAVRSAPFGASAAGTLANLRARVRVGESGLIGLALIVGIIAGLLTIGLSRSAATLHWLLFGHAALSGSSKLDNRWLALVPAAGGLLLGCANLLFVRYRPRRPVDPIEANALQGGRMSVVDSVAIGVQTLMSCGFGASVGLEAGYSQLGAGFASWAGRFFALRRADLRMLVGAGAGAAIAAAFGAPLTGAFYAFEIIIGSYTPFGLAPVMVAAIAGVLVARTVGLGEPFIGSLSTAVTLNGESALSIGLLALVCAVVGIVVMRGVTLTEDLFRRSRLPVLLRPCLGGLALGAAALVTPHILSAGHGALFVLLHGVPPALGLLALTLVLKIAASAISIGSGFRGGLFFASLYLGGLTGELFFGVLQIIAPSADIDASTCAIVGMAGLSVTIVGGPLTMAFLALETTGNLALSILILAVTTTVSVIVRRTFGYSFATWRLHLRGESIRSAQDVGWIRSLTVGRLMRGEVEPAFADQSIGTFLKQHPLGSDHWVVAVDPFGRYAGLVSLSDAHNLLLDPQKCREPLTSLLKFRTTVLMPEMNIKEAAEIFERIEAEALAVVASPTDRRVIGTLTEAHALRRYSQELDSVRRDLSGENWMGRRKPLAGC